MAEARDAAGHRQRLKERFLKATLAGFHDYEVLEILLTYAIPRRDVKPIAKSLINRFKGLKGVFEATFEDLTSVKGIGENTALFLLLLKEIAYAYLKEQGGGKNVIRAPKDAVALLESMAGGAADVERFLAIYLNSKNEVLQLETLHTGAIEKFSVSARDVIEKAIKHNGRSVIFVHALTGGKPIPSNKEKYLSQELSGAASAVDIIVHDYLIKGKNGFLSAREEGWIK